MKKLIIAVALALGLVAGSASGQTHYYSGNTWYASCNGSSNYDKGVCYAQLLGIEQGMDAHTEINGMKPSYCDSSSVTLEQKKDIFMQFLQKHPEHRHIHAGILFITAMREAFPCPK